MSASQSPAIEAGKVVTLHYTLRDSAGNELDSSGTDEPIQYLHGIGMIVPGLEEGLAGKRQGERAKVVVKPEDGYGERDPRGIQEVSRDTFPPDTALEPGTEFEAEGPDGDPILATVVAVAADKVTIDLNHPLAGLTLYFDVSIKEVRDATAEELAHGHAHGPEGHEHEGHD
ncbi:MAG: peptidylprolyl isomerase, partial [Planctomycetota bacterium]